MQGDDGAAGGSASLEDQIADSLMVFASSGQTRVPPAVQEAAIFRRPWFERRFLPALAGIPESRLPAEAAATRAALWTLLSQQGRIPATALAPGTPEAAAAAARMLPRLLAEPTRLAPPASTSAAARVEGRACRVG